MLLIIYKCLSSEQSWKGNVGKVLEPFNGGGDEFEAGASIKNTTIKKVENDLKEKLKRNISSLKQAPCPKVLQNASCLTVSSEASAREKKNQFTKVSPSDQSLSHFQIMNSKWKGKKSRIPASC